MGNIFPVFSLCQLYQMICLQIISPNLMNGFQLYYVVVPGFLIEPCFIVPLASKQAITELYHYNDKILKAVSQYK